VAWQDAIWFPPWRDMPMPPPLQHPRRRRYVRWMPLTHNGQRTPQNRACAGCDDQMTNEEIADYHVHFVPGRARGHA
jgi:hypothetical protein